MPHESSALWWLMEVRQVVPMCHIYSKSKIAARTKVFMEKEIVLEQCQTTKYILKQL